MPDILTLFALTDAGTDAGTLHLSSLKSLLTSTAVLSWANIKKKPCSTGLMASAARFL